MPDRFGKISIHQNPSTPPPDTPEAIAVKKVAPPQAPGKIKKERKRPPSRKKAYAIFWLITLACLIGLYLTFGFLAVPHYLATALPQNLKESSGVTLDLGTITFNPLTFHFSVSQAKLSDAQGNPLSTLGHLAADLAPVSLLRLDLVCNTVTLSELTLHLSRDKNGTYNFSQLFGKRSGEKASDLLNFSDLPFFFSLNNIVIKESKILFSDAPTGKTHSVDKLHMELPSFSNIPFHSDQYLRPSFSAVINGSPVELVGKAFVGESGEGATTLTASLHGLDLPQYAEYLPLPIPFIFTAGKIDGTIDFIFEPTSKDEDKLAIDFKLQTTDAEFNSEQESLFVTSPHTEVAGRMRPMARSLAFSSIAAQKPTFHTFGSNLLESLNPLVKPENIQAKTTTASLSATPSPLTMSIDSLAISEASFHLWAEKGANQPKSSWIGMELEIKNYDSQASQDTAKEESSTFTLKGGKAAGSSTFSWQGKLAPAGRQTGELLLNEFDLAEMLTALGGDDTLAVQGRADLKGTLTISLPEKASENLTFKVSDGELQAREVKVTENKQVVFEAPKVLFSSLGTALKTIHFGKISMDGGSLQLAAGAVPNLFRTFSGGKYLLQELDFKGQIALKDSTGKKKSQYPEVTVIAKNLDTLEKAKENLQFSAKTATGGTIEGRGDMRLAPFSIALDTSFSNLPASEVFPLVAPSSLLAGLSGILSGKGSFTLPKVGYSGDLAIDKGSLPIPSAQPFIWKNLSLQGLNYTREPKHLGVVSADFDQPQLTWQLGEAENGHLAQFATFLQKHLPDPPSPPKAGDGNDIAVSTVDLQAITFKDGLILLQDPRLTPKWKGDVSSLSGTIGAITSSKTAEGSDFSLNGKLVDSGFTINGRLQVFSPTDNGEYHLSLDSWPLSHLQEQLSSLPEIDSKSGYCTLKLDGFMQDGQIRNKGMVTVGKVKATSYKSDSALALALLTDAFDTFTLDFDFAGIPASGKAALINEILALFQTKVVKASVSPLLLASGDYSDLIGNEFIAFEPGQTLLSENGKAILGRYGELLQTHPLLGIELSEGVDRDSDVPVLKEQLIAKEHQRVEEENRKRYEEWLREKEIFEQKVAEQQKKLAAKAKPGEPLPPPAVLKDYIPLQPKAVNVDNAMLLDLARKRVQLLMQQFTEQFEIAAGRLTIEPLKKVPSQGDGAVGPAVKVELITTK